MLDSLTLRKMIDYAETAIHYYRDFRVDVLVATVGDELPEKVVGWKATLAAIEATESARDA